MHIKISKTNATRKPTPRITLTPAAIESAVAAYLANGGRITTR